MVPKGDMMDNFIVRPLVMSLESWGCKQVCEGLNHPQSVFGSQCSALGTTVVGLKEREERSPSGFSGASSPASCNVSSCRVALTTGTVHGRIREGAGHPRA